MTMVVYLNGVPCSWSVVRECVQTRCSPRFRILPRCTIDGRRMDPSFADVQRQVVEGVPMYGFPWPRAHRDAASTHASIEQTPAPAPASAPGTESATATAAAAVSATSSVVFVSRKLASIQRIDAIAPVDGADRVVAARILGWTCVVSKGARVGDAVVYFEIDSLLPSNRRCFSFLKDSGCYVRCEGVGEGYRIKTRKIRGTLSQGLAVPLQDLVHELVCAPSIIPRVMVDDDETPAERAAWPADDVRAAIRAAGPQLGLDVTDALGVLKYEVLDPFQAALAGGTFPAFLKKTDQERIQNCFSKMRARFVASDAAGNPEAFEVTLKLDGTSCTAFHFNGDAGVCSRNLRLKDGDDGGTYSLLGGHIAAALKDRNLNVAVQGEICGPKISKNREGFVKARFFVFDVWDIDARAFWPADKRRALCADLGLEHVPVISERLTLEGFAFVFDVLAFAERPSIKHKVAEGVVFKSLQDPSVSFKAVSNAYLLKED